MVSPTWVSGRGWGSGGPLMPDQTIARPVVWMRFAIAMPRSNVTPGSVRASANATPSNVLWLSFRTITSQGRSLPEPGPVLRGFCLRTGGATVDMRAIVSLQRRSARDGERDRAEAHGPAAAVVEDADRIPAWASGRHGQAQPVRARYGSGHRGSQQPGRVLRSGRR